MIPESLSIRNAVGLVASAAPGSGLRTNTGNARCLVCGGPDALFDPNRHQQVCGMRSCFDAWTAVWDWLARQRRLVVDVVEVMEVHPDYPDGLLVYGLCNGHPFAAIRPGRARWKLFASRSRNWTRGEAWAIFRALRVWEGK